MLTTIYPITTRFIRLFALCLIPFGFFTTLSAAQAVETKASHCLIQAKNAQIFNHSLNGNDTALYLSADNMLSKQSNLFNIEGNVSIETNHQSIAADSAQYNRKQDRLTAQGNITYREKNLIVESDQLDLNLKTNSGIAKNTRYLLPKQNTNGIAGEITFQDNDLVLTESTYSTCEGDNKTWQIRAKSIELHPERNEGIARNMRLEIKNIPILYLPYISFPIEGRKSGFLAPQPSYSSNAGFDVAIPYYFNLKPNYDLTLVPRIIDSRGSQMSADFRYLQAKSNGSIGIEVLPSDKKTQSNRSHLRFSHNQTISDDSNVSIDYTQVSDKRYFSDLGTELNTKSTAQLNRSIRFETRGQTWLFNSLFQDYQMLDNNAEPYRRLPQLNLAVINELGYLKWRINTQYSYYRKNSGDALHRGIFSPVLSIPIARQFGYFTPELNLHSVFYQRNNSQKTERLVNWRFTQKTGLFFERNSKNVVQTLTPELQYTYIPYKAQSQLPIIDSNLLNYDIDQLFSANRYSGYDRIGDENRLSWSLSTNYQYRGKPLFSAQLAQALYLAKHQSQLLGERAIEKNDVVNAAIVKGQLSSQFSTKAQAYYFSGERRLNNGNVSLNYKSNDAQYEQVSLTYRYRDQLVEQLSLVGIVDVSPQWRIAGRWLYSLNTQRTREALLGLEYNNCCWAIRFMTRQYASQANAGLNISIGVQIELKGLTRIGSSLNKQFSDEVFGNQ